MTRLARAAVGVVAALGSLTVVAVGAVGVFVIGGDAGRVGAMLGALAWVSLGVLALGAVAAWLGGRDLMADLGYLTQRLHAMASEERQEPAAVRSLDEIGELTRAFEALRRRFVENVDRERLARLQAEEADRYKTEFLTAVSHELRTPLNSVLGFSQVLLDEIDGPLSASQREDVELIQSAGQHLLALFNEVLDLSSMASGRITLERARVDVAAVLEESTRLLEAQRREKPVVIRTEIDDGLPPVDADPKRLRQILMNLATNALKFTERGAVTLGARRDAGRVEIFVRDTGAGIDPDELTTIFEEYRQVGDVRQRRRGAGLGLAICKRLVELHGGEISVESVVDRGSTFRVWLPVRSDA